MLTFTAGPGRPDGPENPGACPRCTQTGPVEVSLRTERVIFYRCPECGHMWIVKISTTVA